MKVPALLKNKYVFYGLAALAVLNVVGYASVRAWECLALFVLTAYSAHCYCSNESLSILAALFVANFVFGCGRVKEGMVEAMADAGDHMEKAAEQLKNAAAKCGDHDTEEKCKAMKSANGLVRSVRKKKVWKVPQIWVKLLLPHQQMNKLTIL